MHLRGVKDIVQHAGAALNVAMGQHTNEGCD